MRKPILLSLLSVLLITAILAGATLVSGTERPFTALSAEERKWLDGNRDNIVLSYDAAFPPLEFQDENGDFAGIGADIITRIEKMLGVTFQKRPCRDWNAVLAGLESGETHLNAVIARTPERERYASFTAPYLSLPLGIITTKRAFPKSATLADLEGRSVAVVSGYAAENYVRERARGHFEVVPVKNVQRGLRDVSFGVVDAYVENLAVAAYFIEQEGLSNLRVAGSLGYTFAWSLGVSRKHPLLFSAVQKALAEIPAEDIEASRKRWISLSGEGGLSPETEHLLTLAGTFLVLLLIALAGISYFLKRRLNEKVCSLRQAQQELLDQTERLGLATEATNAGVWDFYPATGQAYFSDQFYTMLGYTPGAVVPSFAGWIGLLHPDDRVSADHALMGYIDTGGEGLFEAEYRMLQADGAYRWVLGKGRAIAWDQDGIPTRLVGLNLDIQKLKGVQEELRRSEALAKATLDQTFQFSGLLDTDGHVVSVNQRILAFSGVSREDVVGRLFWDCPWWPDNKEAEGFLRQAVATALGGNVARREVVQVNVSGKRAVVDFSLSPLTGPDGSVAYLIAEGRDITEMRQAETALKQSEEKYRAIFTNAPIGIFRTNFAGQLLEANPALARMHGCESVQEYIHWAKDLGKGRYAHPEDRQRLLDELLKSPSGVCMATELRRKDGSSLLGIINASLHFDAEGRPAWLEGTIEDVSERKRAEDALKQSEEKYRAIFNNAPLGIFRTLFSGRFAEANPAFAHMLGYADSEDLIRSATDLARDIYPNRAERQRMLDALLASPGGISMEIEFKRKDGSPLLAIINSSLHRDENGAPSFIDGTIEDITERKRAEVALKESEEKYRAIFNNAPVGIFRSSFDGQLLAANPTLARMLGYADSEELTGPTTDLVRDIYPNQAARQRMLDALLASPGGINMELEFRRKGGSPFQAIFRAALHFDAEGRPAWLEGSIEDISERKQAEAALKESEEKFRAIFTNAPIGIFRTSFDGQLLEANPALARMHRCGSVQEYIHWAKDLGKEKYARPEDHRRLLDDLLKSPSGVCMDTELRRQDGSTFQAIINAALHLDEHGAPTFLDGTIEDITERKQAEERLRQSEEKFSRIFEMAPEWITFVRLRDSVFIAANAAFEAITGHTREEAIGRTPQDLGIWSDPAMRDEFVKRLLAEGHVKDFEFMLRRKDGAMRHVRASAQLVDIASEQSIVGVFHDITDERRMQELLIQSEKMMSMGNLAAGIAHEINNPLGIVHQAVQNLILRTSPEQKKNLETAASLGLDMNLLQQYLHARKLDVFLEDIQAAALRASGIIRNMLNFSRRSESKRQTCDLHHIIEQSVFLASSDYDLKKSYDFKRVEIVQDLDDILPVCNCTETELEQVILNLLRNAAQAMGMSQPPTPNPRIDIRLRAGESCVHIEVADNGPGMDPDIQRKVFEPFFTTKPPGEGTGLGLSVSYFIITKGHSGKMWLTSSPGKGTTFHIELPAGAPEATHV